MPLEVVLAERERPSGASVVREHGLVKGASGISVTRGVKRPRTAEFTIPEGHPLRAFARLGQRTVAKVYDRRSDSTRALKHHGPITAYKRASAEDGVATTIGSTDPSWYLDRRSCAFQNPRLEMKKRSNVMAWCVQRLNAQSLTDPADFWPFGALDQQWNVLPDHAGAGCGLVARTIESTASILIEDRPHTKVSSIFAECASGLDAPDWAIYPAEPFLAAEGQLRTMIGHLDVLPVIGGPRPNVVFECGMGKRNVSTFEEIIDPNTQANYVRFLTPTGDLWDRDPNWYFDSSAGTYLTDVITTQIPKAPGEGGSFGQVEAGDTGLVSQLIRDHLAVRSEPRQIITFTVAPDVDPDELDLAERNVPRPGIDYDFGDVVTFRATERVPVLADDGQVIAFSEAVTVDALFRVYSLTESDDVNGMRTAQLTVVAS